MACFLSLSRATIGEGLPSGSEEDKEQPWEQRESEQWTTEPPLWRKEELFQRGKLDGSSAQTAKLAKITDKTNLGRI